MWSEAVPNPPMLKPLLILCVIIVGCLTLVWAITNLRFWWALWRWGKDRPPRR